jgi:CRP-like cAMP-binding protein
LFGEGAPRNLKRGAHLYRPGDPADQVFLVTKGHVRITSPIARRGEVVVEVAGPDELLGEEALLPDSGRRYGARAGEACRVVALPGALVSKALRSSRRSYAAFLESTHEDIHRARNTAAARSCLRTRTRLADLIVDLGARFGREEGQGVLIPLRFTHQELADLVGAHRSTITTTLNDWIYRGVLLEKRVGLTIMRPEDLGSVGSRKGGSARTAR